MNRIKFCLLVCTLFGLTACGQEEAVFSLTAAQQEQYSAQIEQITEEYYWDFDGDSLQFSEVKLPENSGAAENLYTASADCTYDMRNYAGSSVVLGTASLVHYNGDVAGQLLCYFSGSTLIGVCYQGGYDNGYYSLQERNPFLADGHFKQYEQWEAPLSTDAFSSSAASFPKDGFVSVGKDAKGNVLTASIQDGAVQIYRYQGGALRLWRTLTFGSGLDATAATFYNGKNGSELAVVLSSLTVQGQGEGEHTYTRSEKIVFYDNNMQRMNTEIALEASQGSALAAEGSRLLVGGEKLIQYYEKGAEGWENTGYTRLKHTIHYIHITDLDGDGTAEYLMSDGLDLYLYQKNGNNFRLIWSTHLGVESLYGAITSGDLNRDGVKEIYICDMTGTAIRYILTEKGLRSSNEDIVYAQCIYACDMNDDGLDDYWLVTDIEARKGSLCIAKEVTQTSAAEK